MRRANRSDEAIPVVVTVAVFGRDCVARIRRAGNRCADCFGQVTTRS